VLASCKEESESEPIIARVGTEYFSHSELIRMIPNDLTPEDSAELASNIIQNWMNEELMFSKAQYNLVTEQTDIENQVEKYRKELFIFEYEKEVINQKLDTSISEDEIDRFYDENQEIFQLKDYILKVRYTKLLPNSPDQEQVVQWMKKDDDESKDALLDYCHKYAISCYTDTNWVFFNQLLRQLPIEVYNKESFLRKGKFVQFTDAEHLYYLYVMDIQSKNTLSPLDLELDRIKGLILNSRKIELLNTIRRSVYREAIRIGNAEKYDEPQIKD
jgi:hypothetical protein